MVPTDVVAHPRQISHGDVNQSQVGETTQTGQGGSDLRILSDNWTAVTADGSLSAQFEQTILVTRDGFESLTPYDL